MHLDLVRENRPAASRNAVVFCCDERYLPFASLAIHTLLSKIAKPDFDICIVSLDTLAIPDVIASGNIRNCQVDMAEKQDGLPISERFSIAAYLRLLLPRLFTEDYDRILYLDCDVMVVGTELNAVFDMSLHGAPLAAAMDSLKLKYPKKQTEDQKAVGESGPYFNSGVLLIDVKVFQDQKVVEKCLAALNHHGAAIRNFDQTLLNIALKENWAQLDLVWNWQWAIARHMFESYLDVQIVHFISAQKPWTDPGGKLPAQYRETALRFLAQHFPQVKVQTCDYPRTLLKRKVIFTLLKHLLRAPKFVRAYNATGGDITKVIAPQDVRVP